MLEARDRVGGRTVNADSGTEGRRDGRGANRTDPGRDRRARAELGVDTFPTYYAGRASHADRRRGAPPPRTVPQLPPTSQAAGRGGVCAASRRRAATVPLDAPWDAPDAEAIDATSFEEWVRRTSAHPEVRDIVPDRLGHPGDAGRRALAALWTVYSLGMRRTASTRWRTSRTAPSRTGSSGARRSSRSAAAERPRPTRSCWTRRSTASRRAATGPSSGRTTRGRGAAGWSSRCRPCSPAGSRSSPRSPPDNDAILLADASRVGDQGDVVYDRAVLARRRALRPAAGSHRGALVRPGQLAARREPGRARGVHRAADARASSGRAPADERRDAAILASLAGVFGPPRGDAVDVLELDWAREPWTRGALTRASPRSGHASPTGGRSGVRTDRSTGRHGDRDDVARVLRRRRLLRAPGGGGGARALGLRGADPSPVPWVA